MVLYFCSFLLYLKNFSQNKSKFFSSPSLLWPWNHPFTHYRITITLLYQNFTTFTSTSYNMQFNAHLNKHRPQNDFTPLSPYTGALKLPFEKSLSRITISHQLSLLQAILSNCFIACAVSDLKAHKLTSVQNCLHFRANISVTLLFSSLSLKCDGILLWWTASALRQLHLSIKLVIRTYLIMVPCRFLPTTTTKFVWTAYRRLMTAKVENFQR